MKMIEYNHFICHFIVNFFRVSSHNFIRQNMTFRKISYCRDRCGLETDF